LYTKSFQLPLCLTELLKFEKIVQNMVFTKSKLTVLVSVNESAKKNNKPNMKIHYNVNH